MRRVAGGRTLWGRAPAAAGSVACVPIPTFPFRKDPDAAISTSDRHSDPARDDHDGDGYQPTVPGEPDVDGIISETTALDWLDEPAELDPDALAAWRHLAQAAPELLEGQWAGAIGYSQACAWRAQAPATSGPVLRSRAVRRPTKVAQCGIRPSDSGATPMPACGRGAGISGSVPTGRRSPKMTRYGANGTRSSPTDTPGIK